MVDRLNELTGIPGWGLVFAAWALAAGIGLVIIAVSALLAWRGRAKRRHR